MYIAIAGIKRSGSTWLANAVRIYLEHAGFKVWMGEELEGEKKEGFDITISKLHPYSVKVRDASDHIFTSYRPVKEIIQSWGRFKGEPLSWSLLDGWLWWLLKWQEDADLLIHYSLILSATGKEVILERIDQVLAESVRKMANAPVFVDLGEVLEELNEMKPPKEGYDPKTCMFHNHRTST